MNPKIDFIILEQPFEICNSPSWILIRVSDIKEVIESLQAQTRIVILLDGTQKIVSDTTLEILNKINALESQT